MRLRDLVPLNMAKNADRQLYLFGASGRLCATAYDSLCLHADAKWPAWWEMPQP